MIRRIFGSTHVWTRGNERLLTGLVIGVVIGQVLGMLVEVIAFPNPKPSKPVWPHSEAYYNAKGYVHMTEGYYKPYGQRNGDVTVQGIKPYLGDED